jgi:hypothetical protein
MSSRFAEGTSIPSTDTHRNPHPNIHRKNTSVLNLGTVPELLFTRQPPGGTPATWFVYIGEPDSYVPENVGMELVFYSKSHLTLRAQETHRKITKLNLGFQAARRTYQTLCQFAERFQSAQATLPEPNPMDGGTVGEPDSVSVITPVIIDNTAITSGWAVVYLTGPDPVSHWMMAGNPRPVKKCDFGGSWNTQTPDHSRMKVETTLSPFKGHFFQPSDYVNTGPARFSIRGGPLEVASPPYMNPFEASLWADWPVNPGTLALLRTSPRVHQSWPAMATGFDTGIFVTGYYWRCGGEEPWFYAPWNRQIGPVNKLFEQKYIPGDEAFFHSHYVFAFGPGTVSIDTDIDVPPHVSVTIIPSIQPPRTVRQGAQSAARNSAVSLLDDADPYLKATSVANLQGHLLHVLPSDSTLALRPPVNYVTSAGAGVQPGRWSILPNSIPICETGFTTMVCERPFNDGADFMYYLNALKTGNPPLPENWTELYSNGPCEILPMYCIPFFNCSVHIVDV